MNQKIEEEFQALIRKKKLRYTSQRKKILEAIFSSYEHFTVEDLQKKLSNIRPKISTATIYRTISLLQEISLLEEIDIGNKNKTYDPNFIKHPSHNHLICTDCGKVIEFESKEMNQLQKKLSEKLGFQMNKQVIKLECSCLSLRENASCEDLIQARLNNKRLPN